MAFVEMGESLSLWEKNSGKNLTVIPLPKPETKSEAMITCGT